MELTSEQQAVLNIFKECDIEEGEYLSVQTLERERLDLSDEIQDNWNAIIRRLIALGYITYDPLGYCLTERGHSQIYRPSG